MRVVNITCLFLYKNSLFIFNPSLLLVFIYNVQLCIGCIWLCSIATILSLRSLEHKQFLRFVTVMTTFLLFQIIFSWFDVLFVLIRPGPRKEIDARQTSQSWRHSIPWLQYWQCWHLGLWGVQFVMQFFPPKKWKRPKNVLWGCL